MGRPNRGKTEVVALAEMLAAMGSEIEGAGTETIVVRGKETLGGR